MCLLGLLTFIPTHSTHSQTPYSTPQLTGYKELLDAPVQGTISLGPQEKFGVFCWDMKANGEINIDFTVDKGTLYLMFADENGTTYPSSIGGPFTIWTPQQSQFNERIHEQYTGTYLIIFENVETPPSDLVVQLTYNIKYWQGGGRLAQIAHKVLTLPVLFPYIAVGWVALGKLQRKIFSRPLKGVDIQSLYAQLRGHLLQLIPVDDILDETPPTNLQFQNNGLNGTISIIPNTKRHQMIGKIYKEFQWDRIYFWITVYIGMLWLRRHGYDGSPFYVCITLILCLTEAGLAIYTRFRIEKQSNIVQTHLVELFSG